MFKYCDGVSDRVDADGDGDEDEDEDEDVDVDADVDVGDRGDVDYVEDVDDIRMIIKIEIEIEMIDRVCNSRMCIFLLLYECINYYY